MLQNPTPRCQAMISLQCEVNAFCRLTAVSYTLASIICRVCITHRDDVSRGEKSHIQGGGLGLERGARMWGAWAQGA